MNESMYVCIRWFDTKCGRGRWKSKVRIAADFLTDSPAFVLLRSFWYQSPLVALGAASRLDHVHGTEMAAPCNAKGHSCVDQPV